MQSSIKNRLFELRKLMKTIGIDYYYIPSTDPHANENVPYCWQRRAWISGFTGSSGDVIVGMENAFLWTDSRYFLQSKQQLNNAFFKLMKVNQCQKPAIDQWLLCGEKRSIVFAADPKTISIRQAEKIEEVLFSNGGKLLFLDNNLVDQLWKDQPVPPNFPLRLYPTKYAGVGAKEKLSALRKSLQLEKAYALVINTLDAIAWLFNIRGNDVNYSPLVLSYAIVTRNESFIFVNTKHLTKEHKTYFKTIQVQVKSYQTFGKTLTEVPNSVWIDPDTTNWWIRKQLKNAENFVYKSSPIILEKALKNSTEQKGSREAHIVDAIAMIRFLHWLENHWKTGVSEVTAAKKLETLRREDPRCLDLSFPSISGFDAHSAIVHYIATSETDVTIDDSALYLIDSGGQYFSGTTDITRTVHLGNPTKKQKHLYTLVLKGHLAIRNAIFPKGTCGEHLNAFAHQFLWREALDYSHGTGHGVGNYLCVHEGPQAITTCYTKIPLQPGMIVSNEPGVYIENQYGIRIENLCLVTEQFKVNNSPTGHGPFYRFEDLTLVPYCRKLINLPDLTKQEMNQINNYHRRIYLALKDLLSTNNELAHWLHQETSPL
ncbi:aminopeptidase P family protein [Coxiella endosymbiont of Amblyomma sculptum]|uniref:aminopeptidase P family protein n=1 Tax=Coxiella endosymbiont of Amblyomma sculptum TaxID=2487929 RepID=UPI00132E9981|nr:aminopeptidase P family protein [Coxiella endosymbiont of Amblyomma sculptum]QHG92401.1 aminopeptidase P family protein [Coxiella endosymbiont of Amblyomma sculptum]